MNPKENQEIPVIHVGPSLVWDLSDAETTKPKRSNYDMLIEVAETAVRLAEESGADSDEVETLSMLIESLRAS